MAENMDTPRGEDLSASERLAMMWNLSKAARDRFNVRNETEWRLVFGLCTAFGLSRFRRRYSGMALTVAASGGSAKELHIGYDRKDSDEPAAVRREVERALAARDTRHGRGRQ